VTNPTVYHTANLLGRLGELRTLFERRRAKVRRYHQPGGHDQDRHAGDDPSSLAKELIRIHNAASAEYKKAFASVGAQMWHDDDAHPLKDAGGIAYALTLGHKFNIPYPLTALDKFPKARKRLPELEAKLDAIHKKYNAEWKKISAKKPKKKYHQPGGHDQEGHGNWAEGGGPGAGSNDEPVLTEKQFYRQYYVHIDIRGRAGTAAANREQILRDGFKSQYVNVLPAQAPFPPGYKPNVMEARYAPQKGDVIYLVPRAALVRGRNGSKVKPGWKPRPYETFTFDDPSKALYAYYLEAKNPYRPGRNKYGEKGFITKAGYFVSAEEMAAWKLITKHHLPGGYRPKKKYHQPGGHDQDRHAGDDPRARLKESLDKAKQVIRLPDGSYEFGDKQFQHIGVARAVYKKNFPSMIDANGAFVDTSDWAAFRDSFYGASGKYKAGQFGERGILLASGRFLSTRDLDEMKLDVGFYHLPGGHDQQKHAGDVWPPTWLDPAAAKAKLKAKWKEQDKMNVEDIDKENEQLDKEELVKNKQDKQDLAEHLAAIAKQEKDKGKPGEDDLPSLEVQRALKVANHMWWKTLDMPEQDALLSYTRSGYYEINRCLRINLGCDSETTMQRIQHLTEAMKRARLPVDTIVYRQAGERWAANLEVGTVFKDKGFTSTTIAANQAHGMSDYRQHVFVTIKVPKGSSAMYLGDKSDVPSEKEVLLAAGSRFKVTKIETKKYPFGKIDQLRKLVEVELLP
jgi:hypothetical protein